MHFCSFRSRINSLPRGHKLSQTTQPVSDLVASSAHVFRLLRYITFDIGAAQQFSRSLHFCPLSRQDLHSPCKALPCHPGEYSLVHTLPAPCLAQEVGGRLMLEIRLPAKEVVPHLVPDTQHFDKTKPWLEHVCAFIAVTHGRHRELRRGRFLACDLHELDRIDVVEAGIFQGCFSPVAD